MAYKLLIDGRLVDGASTLDVVEPATGKVFATCARADEAQLEEAIAAAKRAFPAWSSLAPAKRQDYLIRLPHALGARDNALCTLLTRAHAKPTAQARLLGRGILARERPLAAMQFLIDT